MKKTLSLILALAMVVAMFAGIIPTANAAVVLNPTKTITAHTGYVVLRAGGTQYQGAPTFTLSTLYFAQGTNGLPNNGYNAGAQYYFHNVTGPIVAKAQLMNVFATTTTPVANTGDVVYYVSALDGKTYYSADAATVPAVVAAINAGTAVALTENVYKVDFPAKHIYGGSDVTVPAYIPVSALNPVANAYTSYYTASTQSAPGASSITTNVANPGGAVLPVYSYSAATPFYVSAVLDQTAGAGEYAIYALRLNDVSADTTFLEAYQKADAAAKALSVDAITIGTAMSNSAIFVAGANKTNAGGVVYQGMFDMLAYNAAANNVQPIIGTTPFTKPITKVSDDAFTFDAVTAQNKTTVMLPITSNHDAFKNSDAAGTFYTFVLVRTDAAGNITADFSGVPVAVRKDTAYTEVTIPSTFEFGPGNLYGAKVAKETAFATAPVATFTNVANGDFFKIVGTPTSSTNKAYTFAWAGLVSGVSGSRVGETGTDKSYLIDQYVAPATYNVTINDGNSVIGTGMLTTSYTTSAITIVSNGATSQFAGQSSLLRFFNGKNAEDITIRSTLLNTPVTVTIYDAKGEEFIAYQTTTAAYANYPVNFKLQQVIQYYTTQNTFANGYYKMVVSHTQADGTVLSSNAITFYVGDASTKWTSITPSETTIEIPVGVATKLSDVLSYKVAPEAQTTAGFNTFYNAIVAGGKTVNVAPVANTAASQLQVLNGLASEKGEPTLLGVTAGTYTIEIKGNMNASSQVSTKVTVVVKDSSSFFSVDNTAIRLDGTPGIEASYTIKTEQDDDKVVVGKTFTSNDESIVTVDANGVLTPVAEGETTIVVTSSFPKTKTVIEVTVCPPVEYLLYLPEYEINMQVGQIKMSRAYVVPKAAYNRAVTYASDDESVAFVLPNGNVVGLKAGKVILTATAVATGETQTVTVNVI